MIFAKTMPPLALRTALSPRPHGDGGGILCFGLRPQAPQMWRWRITVKAGPGPTAPAVAHCGSGAVRPRRFRWRCICGNNAAFRKETIRQRINNQLSFLASRQPWNLNVPKQRSSVSKNGGSLQRDCLHVIRGPVSG